MKAECVLNKETRVTLYTGHRTKTKHTQKAKTLRNRDPPTNTGMNPQCVRRISTYF